MSDHPNILIADDEPTIRRALSMCCQRAGYETTLVEDGLEALILAHSTSYHLIITDYRMPRMNGVNLCRHLRSCDRHQQTPIIMCSSALADLDTAALQQELGQIVFVAKPLDLYRLADVSNLIGDTAAPPLDFV